MKACGRKLACVIPGFESSSEGRPALRASGANEHHQAFYVGWQLLKVAVAALLAYAIWRSYQSPDLMLDLSSWRLC